MIVFPEEPMKANSWLKEMKDALLEKENANVIIVSWQKGANYSLPQAIGNTRLVGAMVHTLNCTTLV